MTRYSLILTLLIAGALLSACAGEAFDAESDVARVQPESRIAAVEAPFRATDPLEVQDAPLPPESAVSSDVPAPIDLPRFEDRQQLMKAMGAAARKVGAPNADAAREAAIAIGEYSLAARHPRFNPEGAEYERLAVELWQANQAVQQALSPGAAAAAFQQAFRAQRDACAACHKAFRVEEG